MGIFGDYDVSNTHHFFALVIIVIDNQTLRHPYAALPPPYHQITTYRPTDELLSPYWLTILLAARRSPASTACLLLLKSMTLDRLYSLAPLLPYHPLSALIPPRSRKSPSSNRLNRTTRHPTTQPHATQPAHINETHYTTFS
ncbi:hypothetical protein CVT26_009519 [Gymnopilus dilepis]|uniref:Uncharacterized protein n=1 Tax=Gymnopilus dilepis TaxID=231916 RepID=A0A409VK05_9AGAR|nr:hypothetical protein CVT26_009519 [Gymnopilus dilepis]